MNVPLVLKDQAPKLFSLFMTNLHGMNTSWFGGTVTMTQHNFFF